ncbi:10566_t:CDS:2 [Entrophospora sp. SA101]|nr:10566_t:CDS:2 [Entrophospora sp. SA101]
MENSTHEHQRYYIFVEWKNGTSVADIHKKLIVVEGDKALSKSTIYRWIEAFELGQQTIKDEILMALYSSSLLKFSILTFLTHSLYKRRILFLNGNELDFVTQEIIENEKRIGIPALPSRIKNLIHNLNALNEYDQSEKEKKFIEGLFHIMLHFASLFSKNALILDTELDVGVTYIYKPLDIIRNWADVNMYVVQSWGLVSLGDNEGHKGLHWELFTMRQPHPRVFYWTQVLNTPLPSQNSKKSFLTFTLPLETVFTLAVSTIDQIYK